MPLKGWHPYASLVTGGWAVGLHQVQQERAHYGE